MTDPQTTPPAQGRAWRFSAWSVAWIFWIVFFLVVETAAIISKRDPGGTFSENWWAFFRVHDRVPWWARTGMLAVQLLFLGWLILHLPFGLLSWGAE